MNAADTLRRGISAQPINQTPLFGQWCAPIENSFYLAAIDCAERKGVLVAAGVEEFSDLEKFAIRVMALQSVFRNS